MMYREGHIARMEEGRSTFQILTSKPTGKRPLGRPTRIWEEILEWTLKIYVSMWEIGLIWTRIGIIGDPL